VGTNSGTKRCQITKKWGGGDHPGGWFEKSQCVIQTIVKEALISVETSSRDVHHLGARARGNENIRIVERMEEMGWVLKIGKGGNV